MPWHLLLGLDGVFTGVSYFIMLYYYICVHVYIQYMLTYFLYVQ